MKKKTLLRILMLIVASGIITTFMPRNDRKSLSYELGTPWRNNLLTAGFDVPIYLDSATMQRQTDSITRNFAPYITVSDTVAQTVIQRLQFSGISPQKLMRLKPLVAHVYSVGVIGDELNKQIDNSRTHSVRSMDEEENTGYLTDGTPMLSRQEACKWIIDGYQGGWSSIDEIDTEDIQKLRDAISPNVLIDSVNSQKYLNLELQSVNAGQGKIRQGQRIVDRGEIITPQIYTNLQTYERMLDEQNDSGTYHILGLIVAQVVFTWLVLLAFYGYLYVYRPQFFRSIRHMAFFMTLITIFVVAASLLHTFGGTMGQYVLPYAMVAVMVMIFADSRTAMAALFTTVLLCFPMATFSLQFIVTEMLVGFAAMISLNQLSRRSQLLRAALIVFVGYCVLSVVLTYLNGSTLYDISPRLYLTFGVNALLFSLTYVLLFLVEKMFGFTSIVTLVELSDINNPLLRRLSEEAPGTFQHSMQVSTLASEAARAIGANTQLVRTGALYHDIGKMRSPVFFTENQHGVNPHDGLPPELSAQRIISHITDGVAMAEKHKLPRVVTDFIREHHGHGLTRYFYNTACNALPEGAPEPDKAPFTYPGPNPQSRETAILMMADAVEAASRSLKEYTPQSISDLVDRIIEGQMKEGMYRNAPLSFADIEKIKDTFKKRLSTIYHTRVAYPDRK